jgi:uncharacterized protein YjiS (DUF1127 family)
MALAHDNEAAKYAAISERLAKTRLRCRLWSWRSGLAMLVHFFPAWRRNRGEQRHLACLSDRDLKDIGLSRDDVTDASPPSFWFR